MEPGETGKVGLKGHGAALPTHIPIWASGQASLAGKCSPACLVFLGWETLTPPSPILLHSPTPLWVSHTAACGHPCGWSRDAGLAKHSDAKVLLV